MQVHVHSSVTLTCHCLFTGISPSKRGEVWSMLAKQYQARNEIDRSLPPGLTDQDGFRQLLEEETEFENNILVDIGTCTV